MARIGIFLRIKGFSNDNVGVMELTYHLISGDRVFKAGFLSLLIIYAIWRFWV